MTKQEREYSEEFLEYTEFIVKHETYRTLPGKYKKDGSIRWVVSGNSELGIKRAEWWDNLVEKYGMNNRAEVARLIHPQELKGMKPCQICGKKLNINYVYPTKNTLKKINDMGYSFESYDLTIDEIFDEIFKIDNEDDLNQIMKIFKIPSKIEIDKNSFLEYVKDNSEKMLSPGVMSNAPDRLDGFHSYNACCRSIQDTGRFKSNLSRYSQDRRAYEYWSEGNWNLANRLMGEFKKCNEKYICPRCGKKKKMTADHIGPISLGFTHRAKFNPLCSSCNSQKNNRMTLTDVKDLIDDEIEGEKVISWHTKYLWDNLKNKIESDEDALKLSKMMREHLHTVLTILSKIKNDGYADFLSVYLHEEYSFYDYTFDNFNPLKLDELIIHEKPLENKNKKKNSERYLRISFDVLDKYIDKENRKYKTVIIDDDDLLYQDLLALLERENYDDARQCLNLIIEKVSEKEIKMYYD